MQLKKCVVCGSNELKKTGNICECVYCGSKFALDEKENFAAKEVTEAKIIALLEKSKILHALNKYSEELDILIKALELEPNNVDVTVNLGRCYRCMGRIDKALECYNKALELKPDEGMVYINIGAIYLLSGNYKEAAKCYEKGLPKINKAEYDYWVSYANYAIVIAKLGDKKTAKKMIKEAEAHGYKNGKNARKMAGINEIW